MIKPYAFSHSHGLSHRTETVYHCRVSGISAYHIQLIFSPVEYLAIAFSYRYLCSKGSINIILSCRGILACQHIIPVLVQPEVFTHCHGLSYCPKIIYDCSIRCIYTYSIERIITFISIPYLIITFACCLLSAKSSVYIVMSYRCVRTRPESVTIRIKPYILPESHSRPYRSKSIYHRRCRRICSYRIFDIILGLLAPDLVIALSYRLLRAKCSVYIVLGHSCI